MSLCSPIRQYCHLHVSPNVKFFNTEQAEKETSNVPREIVNKARKADEKRTDCKAWKQKNIAGKFKSVAFAKAVSVPEDCSMPAKSTGYEPFLFNGSVSLCADSLGNPVSILRDTGAAQSFILADALPFSARTYSGTAVLVHGIELGCVRVPVHVMAKSCWGMTWQVARPFPLQLW